MNENLPPERDKMRDPFDMARDRKQARLLFQHDIDAALVVSLDRFALINLKYADTATVMTDDAANHAADLMYSAACLIVKYQLGKRSNFIENAQDMFTEAQAAVKRDDEKTTVKLA